MAGAITFDFDQVIHTQYLACSEVGQQIGALDYLICELFENYRETDKEFLSLGRSTEDSGSLNQGLLTYKQDLGLK